MTTLALLLISLIMAALEGLIDFIIDLVFVFAKELQLFIVALIAHLLKVRFFWVVSLAAVLEGELLGWVLKGAVHFLNVPEKTILVAIFLSAYTSRIFALFYLYILEGDTPDFLTFVMEHALSDLNASIEMSVEVGGDDIPISEEEIESRGREAAWARLFFSVADGAVISFFAWSVVSPLI